MYMARKFTLQPLRKYNVKHTKVRNFLFDMPCLEITEEHKVYPPIKVAFIFILVKYT